MTQKRPLPSMGSSGKLSAGASLQFLAAMQNGASSSQQLFIAFITLMRRLVDFVKFQELPESCVFHLLLLSCEFTSSLGVGVSVWRKQPHTVNVPMGSGVCTRVSQLVYCFGTVLEEVGH